MWMRISLFSHFFGGWGNTVLSNSVRVFFSRCGRFTGTKGSTDVLTPAVVILLTEDALLIIDLCYVVLLNYALEEEDFFWMMIGCWMRRSSVGPFVGCTFNPIAAEHWQWEWHWEWLWLSFGDWFWLMVSFFIRFYLTWVSFFSNCDIVVSEFKCSYIHSTHYLYFDNTIQSISQFKSGITIFRANLVFNGIFIRSSTFFAISYFLLSLRSIISILMDSML